MFKASGTSRNASTASLLYCLSQIASEALALAIMELVAQPAVIKTARDELNQRRNGNPSPPLVGAFHTFTRDPDSFWNNTWNEPLTIEEAGNFSSNQ